MSNTSVTLDPTTRFGRGVALAQERFEEIVRVAPWVWSVPSCSGEGAYRVDLRAGECSCPDRTPEDERCKHEVAARYVKARTAHCDAGCGERHRIARMWEAPEGHAVFYAGELVCGDCARRHGVR